MCVSLQLYGDALDAAKEQEIENFRISISHCDDMVMAAAIAVKGEEKGALHGI